MDTDMEALAALIDAAIDKRLKGLDYGELASRIIPHILDENRRTGGGE